MSALSLVPESARPEIDQAVIAHIEALHRYGNSRGFVNESWATTTFRQTFKVARQLCADNVDTVMGFEIAYRPGNAYISASVSGIVVSGLKFYRELPLTGELAATFAAELEALAMVRATREQKQAEDEQLRLRAKQRLELVLSLTTQRPVAKDTDD